MAYLAGAYPGYCCMKQLGVLQALPPPPPSLLLMHEALTSIISPPLPEWDGSSTHPLPQPTFKQVSLTVYQ